MKGDARVRLPVDSFDDVDLPGVRPVGAERPPGGPGTADGSGLVGNIGDD